MKKHIRCILSVLATVTAFNLQPAIVHAQGTAFAYSGQLSDGGNPANGSYDLTFTLFATDTGGVGVAGPVTNLATEVVNGQYSVVLDFGAVFDGNPRWV